MLASACMHTVHYSTGSSIPGVAGITYSLWVRKTRRGGGGMKHREINWGSEKSIKIFSYVFWMTLTVWEWQKKRFNSGPKQVYKARLLFFSHSWAFSTSNSTFMYYRALFWRPERGKNMRSWKKSFFTRENCLINTTFFRKKSYSQTFFNYLHP